MGLPKLSSRIAFATACALSIAPVMNQSTAYGADGLSARLSALIQRAEKTKSDSLLVVQDGKTLVERYSAGTSKAQPAYSMTKSLINLAIGILVDEGRIASIDAPVSQFFPEMARGKKSQITLRHLLNHTSGLPPDSGAGQNIDVVQAALDAELIHDPGTFFEYNGKAVNLLSGVVQKVSGKRADLFLKEKLFTPLRITRYLWELDAANHARGSTGLSMHARDLAKIGQMLLNDGVYQGKRIVSESWIRKSVEPSQGFDAHCGLLWWLVNWTHAQGYYAYGSFGQQLVIVPESRTVGVRLYRKLDSVDPKDTFDDFTTRVAQLND